MAKTPYYVRLERKGVFEQHLYADETLGETVVLWDDKSGEFRQFVRVIRKPKKDPPRTR